jgi:hypothetical protein
MLPGRVQLIRNLVPPIFARTILNGLGEARHAERPPGASKVFHFQGSWREDKLDSIQKLRRGLQQTGAEGDQIISRSAKTMAENRHEFRRTFGHDCITFASGVVSLFQCGHAPDLLARKDVVV